MWLRLMWQKGENPVEYSIFYWKSSKFCHPTKQINYFECSLLWSHSSCTKEKCFQPIKCCHSLWNLSQVHLLLVILTFTVVVQAANHLYSRPQWDPTKMVFLLSHLPLNNPSPQNSLRNLFKTGSNLVIALLKVSQWLSTHRIKVKW